MGFGAAMKLDTVLTNTAKVVAVELMCATQGVEQRDLAPAPGTTRVHDMVRSMCPPLERDRPPGPDIERLSSLVESGRLSDV